MQKTSSANVKSSQIVSCFLVLHDDFSVWCVYILLVQTVAWCVMRESSCVLEDDAFSTSTAVTDTMTAGTSVMRGGAFSLPYLGLSEVEWTDIY